MQVVAIANRGREGNVAILDKPVENEKQALELVSKMDIDFETTDVRLVDYEGTGEVIVDNNQFREMLRK